MLVVNTILTRNNFLILAQFCTSKIKKPLNLLLRNLNDFVDVNISVVWYFFLTKLLFSPQDSMELVHKQSKAVAVTCMSFPIGDVNNFVVGSEEGSVYTACRHGR